MPTWVRKNKKGDVVEKTTINPSGRYHPSIVWTLIENNYSARPTLEVDKIKPIPGDVGIPEEDVTEEEVAEDTSNTSVESTEGGEV